MNTLTQSILDRAGNKLSAIEKKRDNVQRQIDVQIQAFALIPKDIEGNDTITYYRKEINRVTSSLDQDITKIDGQIQALEAKKRVIEDRAASERKRYSDMIEAKMEKLQDPEPSTPAFRKLKADITLCAQEESVAQEEFSKACSEMSEANDKRMKTVIREQDEKYARMKQEEFLRDQEEREKIEAALERKCQDDKKLFEAALARATTLRKEVIQSGPIDHVQEAIDALKNALPPRIPKMYKKAKRVVEISELTTGATFTVAELDTISLDYDTNTDIEIELWEKLRHEACQREKVEGHWVSDE